jgi:hypothetical protein
MSPQRNSFVHLNRNSLKKLSEASAGRAFFAKKVTDLNGRFFETGQALQSHDVLSYCGGIRKPESNRLCSD